MNTSTFSVAGSCNHKAVEHKKKEFHKLYKDFYDRMITYIETGSIEDRKLLNDTVIALSEMVCPTNSEKLKDLYMQKIKIFKEPMKELTEEELKAKRAELDKLSSQIAQSFSGCLKVDVDAFRRFLCTSDGLVLIYINSKDASTKEKAHKALMDIISKISLM